ncbi:MAG: hypothetical protein M3Q08_17410 [Pseudomonadota bacterium]|nr:hypothetical protein [Pseudomonadota bacterium]
MMSAAITAGQLIPLFAAFIGFVGVMVGVIVGLVKSLIDRSNDALDQARASIERQLDQQTAELRRLREDTEARNNTLTEHTIALTGSLSGLAERVRHLEDGR